MIETEEGVERMDGTKASFGFIHCNKESKTTKDFVHSYN